MGKLYDWAYRPRKPSVLQVYALLLGLPMLFGVLAAVVDPERQWKQLALVPITLGILIYDRIKRRAPTPPPVIASETPTYRGNARPSDTRDIVAFVEGRRDPDTIPERHPLLALVLALVVGALGNVYVAILFAAVALDGVRSYRRWWVRRRLRRAGLDAELAEYDAATRSR